MWIPVKVGAGQVHTVQQLSRLCRTAFLRSNVEISQWFSYLRRDLQSWIEAGIGILKDHLHVAAGLAEIGLVESQEIFARQRYPTILGRFKPQNRSTNGGFPTSRFAHQGQGFAGKEREGHILYRMDPSRDTPQKTGFDGIACDQLLHV